MTQGVAIQLERVEKRFDAQPVLNRLDLAIAPGEFVAVIGKSGSGKSTLLRLVAGLDTPSAGAVVIDGQPLQARNGEARVMFQDARLLPWKSVLENVGLGLPASGLSERAAEALDHVGLHDRGGAWPLVLSGGERQRVALARALVSGPRLLLLDEPLGALDALTRIEMQLLIERLWQEQGFTAVLITHDVEEAVALADRVLLIEHGHIALDLPIDLPRPRARGSAAFAALKGQLLQRVIGSGWGV